ncbi:MAG: DNA topoisomerase (ATP-hydrolyzing) subunit A, partial [Candidatus Paceibacteria bacterium]
MDVGKLQKREIGDEMRESYLDYAMSVIVSRALPDVRDGLKPVHRRILYSMHEMGLRHDAKYVKSARIVGNTLANFHPHGDIAVYDALVRLAQPFSLRYPLVQGQGNFGSIDGDSPAAQRYTEARLTQIAEELLQDIEKDTVDFQPNYDATKEEPKVLPSRIPNLLLNGSMGIAVGMATNIPPHNLVEVVSALRYLLKHPGATTAELMEYIQGPDFPTGGIIYNKKAIQEAYTIGRGPIVCRGKAEIVERKRGGFDIVITEIPYEVNKSELVAKIAELVEEKRLVGIRDIRDESDKEGLRIVIELKHDAQPERLLNQIYRLTDLEKTFHINMLALVGGIQPQTLSLQALLEEYINHRKEVVRRRTEYDLKKTKERIHILEGLAKALSRIDDVIKTIKLSESRDVAKENLIKKFDLSGLQAEAILAMKLESLARLERQKIIDELNEKNKLSVELQAILKDP